MKQKCIECGLVFYPTKNNYVGYPYIWHRDKDIDSSPARTFHSRYCMDQFLSKHSDILIPIFKQIKERELFYKKDMGVLARSGFDFEVSRRVMDLDKDEYIKIINLL